MEPDFSRLDRHPAGSAAGIAGGDPGAAAERRDLVTAVVAAGYVPGRRGLGPAAATGRASVAGRRGLEGFAGPAGSGHGRPGPPRDPADSIAGAADAADSTGAGAGRGRGSLRPERR